MDDAELFGIIACPACQGRLERSAESTLVCTACGYRYPVRDGIPVLIIDEALAPVQNDAGRRGE